MLVNRKYIITLLSFLLTTITVAAQEKINGNIALQITSNDSMHVVTATVTNIATQMPVKAVELTFYIKRTFGLQKVGDATTDSTGIVSAEFPTTTPGSDSSHTMIVIAKVEDNDLMNDTAFQVRVKSKVPFPADKPIPRSIIGAHAPWWLVITFTLTVGTVWFLFVYVGYLIYLIKKASTVKINS